MLDKLFAKPMELVLAGQTISFLSIADFEFCLSGRTSVPSKKITDMVKCTAVGDEKRYMKKGDSSTIPHLMKKIED